MDNFNEPLFTISTAAKILGISVHTLRMYEREGLIVPFRKESKQRLYSQSDINRLRCIRHAINVDKLSIAGIQVIYSLIPCWDIKKCTETEREKCEAYVNHTKACWMINHKDNICGMTECRDCIVYKEYSECGKIKESIIKLSRKK
jgi:MerR family transcriptional regulator/heat shock protein HspR